MGINRAALKANAKLCIRETRPSPLLVALVLSATLLVINTLSSRLMVQPFVDAWRSGELAEILRRAEMMHPDEMYIYFERVFGNIQNRLSPISWLLGLALDLIVLILGAGFTIYSLNASRRAEVSYGNLLDGFGIFFRIIWLEIVMGVFIFLWSLLLFIPGIVAAYSYRQAFYLMLDHPEWPALRCIRESKLLMRGRKMELFVLDLSFVGWHLLTMIPFVDIWVLPYTTITFANYYNALVGRDAVREDAPPLW